ncbi:MAG: methyltransferase domain-containing protein [Bacteroidota bacterium]
MGKNESDKNDYAASLNQALIDDLKKQGLIKTPQVEAAFQAVFRHWFLPGRPLEEVYSDRAISAKQDPEGKWISSSSQPAIMAIMLEQLGLEPGHKVLEIGTGPGYNAALMAHIVGEEGQVVSVEIDEDLADAARDRLRQAGFDSVKVICADGGYGAPDAAPFDRIILTVGAPDIPPAWWEQMKPGGRLVLPLVLRGSMKSIAFEPVEGHLASLSVTDCGFIPLRGDFASEAPNRVELGPEPGLYVEPTKELSIESDSLYGWLTHPVKDWPANLEISAGDVLGGSLWTWLALHEPRICKLEAENEWVDRNVIPPLFGIDAAKRSAHTVVLIGLNGAAALMRPPDQPLPIVPLEKLFVPDSPAAQPFLLFVRQLGPDESAAEQLLAQIQTWKAAGSPQSLNMHIRAFPKNQDYRPGGDEVLLEKKWTKLAIRWQSSA